MIKACKIKGVLLISLFFIISAAWVSAGQKISFKNPPPSKQPRNPKVASIVDYSVKYFETLPKDEKKAYTSNKKSPLKIDNYPCRITEDGQMQVYIYVNSLNKDILEKLEKNGVKIQLKSQKRNLIQAFIPISKIDAVSIIDNVKLITLPSYGVTFTGRITTEADRDEALGTAKARTELNIDSSNVKVGVMSDGIETLVGRNYRSGEIPNFGGAYSFINYPDATYPQNELLAEGDEGTAMMEIIADIAPTAKLYFSNFGTDLEMNMSKEWLALQGCNIIVDDIGFFTAGPLDGRSEVSMKNSEMVERGIAYYTSQGNLATYHYMGYFTDYGEPNGIHEFSFDSIRQVVDETLEIDDFSAAPGRILLQWDPDDPAGDWVTSDDLDLYVLDGEAPNWSNPMLVSATIQNGDVPPYEFLITTLNMKYSIGVRRKNPENKTPKRFHLFMYQMSNIEYQVTNGSIINNNDAGGGCVGVGAIDVNIPTRTTVEEYSSQGPTDDGRMKPDICCYDGVLTSIGDFNPFFGTSAAAPHVAAVAALMLGINPSLKPAELLSYMQLTATDLGPTGADYISGAGRLEGYKLLKYLYDVKNAANPNSWVRSVKYDFKTYEDGWLPQLLTGLTPPTLYYSSSDQSLVIASTNSTDCYGSWISPVIEFDNSPVVPNKRYLLGNKIYEARFLIKTNPELLADECPTFRLRLGSKNDVAIATKVVNSIVNNQEFPGALGKYYYVYLIPPKSTSIEGLYAAIDLMNLDISDKPDAKIFIDQVVITEKNLP